MTRLLVCAGEASGDRLAAELLQELERRRPMLAVKGIAGPRMRAMGVEPIADAESVTAVGVVEALRVIPRVWQALRAVDEAIERFKPDLVVTIDSPGLMLRIGRRARARGVRVVHWVSPQVWAWRPGRVRAVASAADCVMCLFPMEPALYAGTGVEAVYTGHPAVDRLKDVPRVPRDGPPVFGLAPGSRTSEIEALWPVYRDVAAAVRRRTQSARFVVPVAPTVDRRMLVGVDGAELVDDIAVAGAQADAFLVASGTATLELAALGTPMVVAYKVHPVTWALGKLLVRGVDHLALPNVLAGRSVVPERLQQLRPDELADDLMRLLGDEGTKQREAVAPIVRGLGGGAVVRAADTVERWLDTPSDSGSLRGGR